MVDIHQQSIDGDKHSSGYPIVSAPFSDIDDRLKDETGQPDEDLHDDIDGQDREHSDQEVIERGFHGM